ncbi:MAG: EAL domain-containing protein [Alphaproteobacteria bacterium]|nr:EAL domain-containing protein [Alphaproteobacteria bacterium]
MRTEPGEESKAIANLRYERDRFVAFAFASADAFLEIDGDLKILYATGAVQRLLGQAPEKLTGQRLLNLIDEDSTPLVNAALEIAQNQGRFGPISLNITAPKSVRVIAFGTYLPVEGGRTFVALSAHRMAEPDAPPAQKDLDRETGLLAKDAFQALAQRALTKTNDADRAYKMTMLDLEVVEEIRSRLDDSAADDLISEIAARMQASSINGMSAGRIGAGHYGFVHDADTDVGALKDAISKKAAAADPSVGDIVLPTATVELDGKELSEADSAKAMLFAINKFSQTHGDFTISDLTDGYQSMLEDTRERIVAFKKTIAQGDFQAVFQPIVDIRTRALHHHEALVRFPETGADGSPYEMITFAEEAGVIGDFDIAMVKKVIATINAGKKVGKQVHAAVNLSGKSLESPLFIQTLLNILKDCRPIRNHLMFEVTESSRIDDLEAANKVLQELHKLGHHVCLDDFGAGAAAFQYLRALEVDFVKIDGIYVREAFTTPNGKIFLTSMASLCKELKIQTVGEFVETEEVARFLSQVGVTYGQGYLFGRPGGL